MIKLNLGCGEVLLNDFINIDIREDVLPDVCCDISNLSQFKSNSVDYILAHDVVEHFSHRQVWDVLQEWVRVLKVGGEIEIQVPSIDRIFEKRDETIKNHNGDSSKRFSQLIFGGQDYPSNFHTLAITKEFFRLMEKRLGLALVNYFPKVGNFNHKAILKKLK